MFQIDSADTTASKPAAAAASTEAWFRKNDGAGTLGTVVTADWLNIIQGELRNLLTVTSVAADKDDVTQVEDALRAWPEIAGVLSHATDTTAAPTTHLRVLVASSGDSTGSQVTGAASAAVASWDCTVAGSVSAILACQDCTVPANVSAAIASFGARVHGSGAGFAQSAVIGVDSSGLQNAASNAGLASVIAAVRATTSQNAVITQGAVGCAFLACADGDIIFGATANSCAMVACQGGSITATASAIIASGYDTAGVESDRPVVTGDYSAVLGCDGDVTVSGDNTIVLASSIGTTTRTVSDNNSVVLHDGTNQTIRFEAGGDVFMFSLPTSDPSVSGQLWVNSNVLQVSP